MEHHFNDGTEPTILPHYARCAGPCQQGRAACPCPQSCEQALDRSILRLAGQAFLAIVLAGVVICIGVTLI
jgi:hypothetical protein